MNVRTLSKKKIAMSFLIIVAILGSLGFFGWKHWKQTPPKPGLLKIGQSQPTTSTFDFHELGVKLTLPPELKDLKYFDQVSADKTYAGLNLYMDSYTAAAENCLGVSGDGAVPITLVSRYPGQYTAVKSTLGSFDLVKQFKDYFIVSSKSFTTTCKDANNQTKFNDYDTKIREAIKTTLSEAEAL